nr:hypothetical protein [Tanacetum cinerariifolium]
MDDPNITMEEYIRLEEEKAHRPIVFSDTLTSEAPLSYEPTVSSLNDEIDFRVSFDESDDEDYTIVFEKNSFSYKKNSTNDLKTDSENDNDKINMPLFPSPEPMLMRWQLMIQTEVMVTIAMIREVAKEGQCTLLQLQCGMPSEVCHLHFVGKSEIKKLETKLWNLVVKGTDVESYTQRFQELIFLCSRMVPDESDKVEKYTGRLPDSIQGSVMASKPKMLQEAIELARSLMDQKVHAYAARQVDNKIRMDINTRDNNVQQPPYKRQNVARAYTTGPSEKKRI